MLAAGLARLGVASGGSLSVRSSGLQEDGGGASHAGIYASVVVAGADPAAVMAAVKAFWASWWTETAWAYRWSPRR